MVVKRATSDAPLHYGRAPKWLFNRMVKLSREILRIIVEEYGTTTFLERISDPIWFQALGSFLGFDWHSSGLTTTLTAALKEAVKPLSDELGIFICGGKGATSRKTPEEIKRVCDKTGTDAEPLIYSSRITAKVDSTALQDNYQLYHHTFLFTTDGDWAVVQQGMNETTRYARRYHWLSLKVTSFVSEPHNAIITARKEKEVLNLVADESADCRLAIVELLKDKKELNNFITSITEKKIRLPERHHITHEDFDSTRLKRNITLASEQSPSDFEKLLTIRGVGPKTVRALSLAAEIIHSAPPSFRDPARFAFAHGGKDGHPYPVNRRRYDETIDFLRSITAKAKLPPSEKRPLL